MEFEDFRLSKNDAIVEKCSSEPYNKQADGCAPIFRTKQVDKTTSSGNLHIHDMKLVSILILVLLLKDKD